MAALDVTLTQRIAGAIDPVERWVLRAELAGYLARLGNFEAARSAIAELRAVAGWSSARVMAAIMLAEALIELEDEFATAAMDRLQRGYAISLAAGHRDQAAVFAAWLAHANFNACSFGEMIEWVRKCKSQGLEEFESAQVRLYLTFADAHRYVGEFAASEPWYVASRKIAVATGDAAFLAANMYNRAQYGIARLRLKCVEDNVEIISTEHLLLEIDSAINYATATGNRSARFLQQLCRARLLMMQGYFNEAKPLIYEVIANLPEARHPRLRITFESDIAICNLHTGNAALAQRFFEESPDDVLKILDADDLAVFLNQRSLVLNAIGQVVASTAARRASLIALEKHDSLARQLSGISAA